MRIELTQDVKKIRPLAARWSAGCNGDRFGLTVSVDAALADLDRWFSCIPGTLILAYDGLELVGFFAVAVMSNFLGYEKIALERYWYALPNHVRAGPALFRAAQQWGKANGCTHLTVSASHLASDAHDKVARFCERMGMKPLETVYVGEV